MRWSRRIAVGAAAGVLLIGCTAESTDRPLDAGPALATEAADPTSAPTTSAPTVDPAVATIVIRDYLRYWDGVLAAHAGRDQRAPALLRYSTGPGYDRVAAAVRVNVSRGYLRRGTVGHQPAVLAVDGGVARLRDCADVTRWAVYSARTGARVPIGAAEPRLATTYQLTRTDGRWVVDQATDGAAC